MVLDVAIGYLSRLSFRSDDDSIDRLHYFVTSNVLIAVAILVSWKTFGGKPIECMFPQKFPSSWEQYAENYCWSQDTYFLPPSTHVAEIEASKRYDDGRKLSYYQWVPFFLLLEAACFRLPSLVWKYLAGHSGIRIHEIVKMAIDPNNINQDCKRNNIQALTTHLQNALRFQRRVQRKNIKPHKVLKFLNLPYAAYFVTSMYLLTKVLYLVNVILQLYAMNSFLETDTYGWYGFGVVRDILNGTQWEQSGYFPRVSLCDFEVRQVANIQKYTVQCVLVINIFNEKIFILLWFWYMALMVATLFSFFYWFLLMVLPWFGRWFISRNLELSEMPFDPKGSREDVDRFVNRYLRSDGVFVLRMISMHSGVIFGTDLVLSLWRTFYGMEEQIRKDTGQATPTTKTHHDNRHNFLRLRRKIGKHRKSDPMTDKRSLDSKLIAPADDASSSSSSSDEDVKQRETRQPSAPVASSTASTNVSPSSAVVDSAAIALLAATATPPATDNHTHLDMDVERSRTDDRVHARKESHL